MSNNTYLVSCLHLNKNYISSLSRCLYKLRKTYMLLAHGPLGLTTAYATKKLWNKDFYTSTDKAFLFSLSQVSAILPDLDLAYAIFDTYKTSHHSYITHTPLPYLIIAITLYISSIFIKGKMKRILRSLNFIFILNIIGHLLTDSVVCKIRLLYPFSNREFFFFNVSPIVKTNNQLLSYFLTPGFIILESSIIITSLFILLKLKKDNKIFFFTSLTYSIISIIALLMTLLFLLLL